MNRYVLPVAALLTLCFISLGQADRAEAFCGFYVSGASDGLFNRATRVVMMREGTRTALSMQNDYEGPPENFAMVVPVPVVLQEENVRTIAKSVFDDVDAMAAPRLVEYWEQDPCYQPPDDLDYDFGGDMLLERQTAMPAMAPESAEPLVVVEAEFTVGEYDIVILSARESTGLYNWLKANEYNIPMGARDVLQPYIEQGMYFFVAKVDVQKVSFVEGRARLSPLRFHYDSETFSLPVRLGLINADGPQDLIVHILAQNQRYEVANLENTTIPTNLEVAAPVKNRFAEFYAALFDETVGGDPVAVTEYSWDASTCDPCPGPNLNQNHFRVLGADVMPSGAQWGYTLTRIHVRYSAQNLTEDLVFTAAAPIVGGREITGPNGRLEHGAQPAAMNNFQGRYIIRHAWSGPIACSNPQRGIWGGPPGNPHGRGVSAAKDTALAPRGKFDLVSNLRSPVPELGIHDGDIPDVTEVENRIYDEVQFGCGSCSVSSTSPVVGPAALVGLVGLTVFLGVRRRR